MTALDTGAGLYSNIYISTKVYSFENRVLKFNYGRKFLVKRKNCVDSNVYRKSYIQNYKVAIERVE